MLTIVAVQLGIVVGLAVLFWISAYICSPAASNVSLWRGFGAAILMRLWIGFGELFVQPTFGDWYMLVALGGLPVLFKFMFKISLFRSLSASLLLVVVLIVFGYFFVVRPEKSKERSKQGTPALSTQSC